VGDYAFQQKCHARMGELRTKGTRSFLSPIIWKQFARSATGAGNVPGQNIFQGSAAEAVIAYSDAVRRPPAKPNRCAGEEGLSQRVMTFDAELKR